MTINQKKLEYQLYLARENPEPTFDISECNITKIPQGSYSLCKVLRKKILNIKKNKIKELNSNGNIIEDLIVITHIYAECNEIEKLPENISSVQYLQILDLSHNQLRSLPSSMGSLIYLRKLYLQNNFIKNIPTSMLTDKSGLELLDISENKEFSAIPLGILSLLKLRTFSCTIKYLKYPPQADCQRGVTEMMKVVCHDAGVPFTDKIVHIFSDDIGSDDMDYLLVDSAVLDYESFKQNRIRFLKSIEDEVQKTNFCHDNFRNKASQDKISLINKIADEELRITKEIALLHLDRDLRREQLVNDIKAAEVDAKNVIEEIMAVNRACQEQGKICDDLENESFKQYKVYQEDYSRLRKEEILKIMSQMLISEDNMKQLLKYQLMSKSDLKDKITRSKSLADDSITEILKDQDGKRNNLFSEIEKQEMRQKLAFQNLQLEKDVRTLRIKEQISSVESSLMILTQVEQNKRNEKNTMELNILNERRTELVKLLEILIEEKNHREEDLMNRLTEIERHRTDNQVDFWLIQYQRLLDMKPPDLYEESSTLEELVLDVVNRANAKEYLPFLQRKNVTWDQLRTFQEKDLHIIGIHNSSKIRDILRLTSQVKEEQNKKKECFKSVRHEQPPQPILVPAKPLKLTSHKESECCICMVGQTTILFLECGHICCCEKCSDNLLLCPLCRQTISRFIKLMYS